MLSNRLLYSCHWTHNENVRTGKNGVWNLKPVKVAESRYCMESIYNLYNLHFTMFLFPLETLPKLMRSINQAQFARRAINLGAFGCNNIILWSKTFSFANRRCLPTCGVNWRSYFSINSKLILVASLKSS